MKPEGRIRTPTLKVRQNIANLDLAPVKKKAKIAKTPQTIPQMIPQHTPQPISQPTPNKEKMSEPRAHSKSKAKPESKLLIVSVPEPEVFTESENPKVNPTETILVLRGAAFQVLEKLKDENVRNGVKTLDFAQYYLANMSPTDPIFGPRTETTIMEACPELKEVIIDMRVDDLLFSKTSAGGEFMGWESTPVATIIKRYDLEPVTCLPELQTFKYRLVGDSFAWKKQFAEPTLDKMKEWFGEQTMGRVSVESLGFVGN